MTSAAFDTLKYTKNLENAGFSRQQAEAWIAVEQEILADVLATNKEGFVAREDNSVFKSELKGDLKTMEISLRSEIDVKIATAKLEIIKWLVGSIAASTIAIITTMLKLMH